MGKTFIIITTVLTTLFVIGAIWLMTGGPCEKKLASNIDFAFIKEYADELIDYRLYDQAIEQYQTYLADPSLDREKRAHLNFLIGNIYMDHLSDYESAVGQYLKAKLIVPETQLLSEIDRRIIECLERLGRTREAQRLLQQATALGGDREETEEKSTLSDNDIVVARLGERKITLSELQGQIEKLPDELRGQFGSPAKMQDFLGKYVTSELLYEAARRRGFDKDAQVVDLTNMTKKQLMVEKLYQDEVLSKIEISEADIDLYYRAHKDKFTIPATVTIAQIVVATQKEAQAALDRLNNGEDFTALVQELSLDEETKGKGGRVGAIRRDGYIPGLGDDADFAQAAFEMDVNAFSIPLETRKGWHIIKVIDKTPERVRSLDEVREQVVMEIQREKERAKFEELTGTLGEAQGVEIYDKVLEELQNSGKGKKQP
ncbi:MAG: peptidyl-prolyl cis-trans isomerase [Candidatus Omnitrophica bacterium]|nr:peptidyl-prolyl cis-trans isomerase [Candidatus Omnitrophota bacterium]